MRRLLLGGALLLAMLIPASSAMAAPHSPTGEFKNFGDCPLSNKEVNFCLYSESSAGLFTIGKKEVPIVNPVILQGGFVFGENPETSLVGAEDGNTLSKTPQPVPGGLLGITAPTWWPKFLQDLFNETINNGFTGVTATVELAGPASNVKLNLLNIILAEGTALSLPVKIKLGNPFLGSNCYIGSNSKPIVIDFTSGTTSPPPPNKPITGNPGTITENESSTKLTASGGRLVNNSYAAPGASGCGGLFSFLIDPFVNELVGLPSPAGHNTAILEGKIELGQRGAVEATEP